MAFWKSNWERWLRIAGVIGDFQGRVVLTVFYFIIVLPFGVTVRLFADPLNIQGSRRTTWSDFVERARSMDDVKRQ